MIKFHWEKFSFHNSIIDFIVLHTFSEKKVWILIQNFFSRLNDWIHCMQLWLLIYCLRKWNKNRSFDVHLKHVVREQCRQYLINTNSCSIVELSYWRLFTWIVNNDFVRHVVITINDDCTQINHQTIIMSIKIWRDELRSMLDSINEILENSLLLKFNKVSHYVVFMLIDNSINLRLEKNFLNDLKNELHAIQNWLFWQLRANSKIRERFFKMNLIARYFDDEFIESIFRIRQFKVNEYLLTKQQFFHSLNVLMYWTFDLSFKRKELVNIAWCNQEIARNIYILQEIIIFIVNYHKSSWRIDSRSIVQYSTFAIDELLMRYLIYVFAFVRFLNYCMQSFINKVFFFEKRDKIWSFDRFENHLKRQNVFLFDFVINMRQWRYMIINIDRRICLNVEGKLYEVVQKFEIKTLHAKENFDFELNENLKNSNETSSRTNFSTRFHAWQTSHNSLINNVNYDNDVDLLHDLIDSLFAIFRQVNLQWHRNVVQFANVSFIVNNHKRLLNLNSSSIALSSKRHKMSSRLKVRREHWKWSTIEKSLKSIFESHAKSRSLNQRNELFMIARNRLETLIVMLIESEKSLLFVIFAQLSNAQVTMIIVSLIVLK